MTDNRIPVRDIDTGEVSYIDNTNRTRTMRDAGGKVITMDLGPSDVHIDTALANVAFGYKLAEGVADIAAPVVPTTKASDKYWLWDKDDVFQQVSNVTVSHGAQPSEVSPRLSSTAFATVPYGLQAFVSTETEANADSPLQPRMRATKRILDALLLAREVRVAALICTAGSYNASYKATIGASAKWNGGATSNPVQDLFTRIEAALMPITDIIMSEQTWHDFVQNAAVQKFIQSKINVPGLPTPDQLVGANALLGLPKIHVAAMKCKSPTAGTYGYVWEDYVALLHRPANLPSDGQDIATAYTFRWLGGNVGAQDVVSTSDGIGQGGWLIRSYYDQRRGGRGGTTIVVTHNDVEVLTSDCVSGLLSNCNQ